MYDVFNPLPNNKILDRTGFKAFADNKLLADVVMISVCDRVINTVGKGENAVTSVSKTFFLMLLTVFPPFPEMFSRGFFFRVMEIGDCDVKS